MENHRRHVILWTILRPLVRLIVLLRFNFRSKLCSPDGPFILVCNHVTDLDPLLIGCGFRTQMYFLASEHIMRQGFVSKLLQWGLSPITRQKGGSAAGAVKAMLRVVKEGGNIAFFPEGNRTWDGVTQSFPESTGKLIRSSGASLITYKLSGAYFASPRWSGNSARKGRTKGEIVHIYSPEELRSMTVAEINRAIADDIHEDAYESAKHKACVYNGRDLAEHLETFLFICPKCGKLHSLESKGDRFSCTGCGASARYASTGFFVENKFPFDNVRDWGLWQSGKICEICASSGKNPIFTDNGLQLLRIDSGKSSESLGYGDISLYRDRLELPANISIPISDISGMSLRGATDLYIGTVNGSCFELKADNVCCTKKYLEACIALGCPVSYGI